jgi:hypothetical protein
MNAPVPQNSIVDFMPRWADQGPAEPVSQESEPDKPAKDSCNQFQVFVEMLEQTRIWKLIKDFEWESFKRQAEETLGETK